MTKEDNFNAFLLKMREKYLDEFDEKITEMESLALSAIKKKNYTDDLLEIFRMAHTIKGASGTLSLSTIAVISHKLEDFIYFFTKEKRSDFLEKGEKILEFLDLLRKTRSHYLSSDNNNLWLEDKAQEILNNLYHVNSKKVLIVENSLLLYNLMCTQLEELNAVVYHCQNGADAIKTLSLQTFDALITSNKISGINGKSLIAAVKLSDNKNSKLTAMLLTSNESKDQIIQTMQHLKPNYIFEKNNQLINNVKEAYQALPKVN